MPLDALATGPSRFVADAGAAHAISVKATQASRPKKSRCLMSGLADADHDDEDQEATQPHEDGDGDEPFHHAPSCCSSSMVTHTCPYRWARSHPCRSATASLKLP